MTLVTQLRKMVGHHAQPCPAVPINLTGLEVGTPVSVGASAISTNGSVIAVGDGYEFVTGILTVNTAVGYPVPNYSTFTITGDGIIPTCELVSTTVADRSIIGVSPFGFSGVYAAFRNPGSINPLPYWAVINAPIPVGSPTYTFVVCVGPAFVRVWYNGVSIGRADIYPDYMGPEGEWKLSLGSYGGVDTPYTGKVTSVTWEIGALYPDVDNI